MEVFENGCSASLCGRAKTDVFENDYVTGIGMSKKQNGCFLIRFRWSSVDGRKRCKNASVDGKLFIRFQETENGGFRKRISVDRALINTFPCSSVPTVRLYPPFLCQRNRNFLSMNCSISIIFLRLKSV